MFRKNINDIPYLKNNKEIIELLLIDKTKNKPIIWACDNYVKKGSEYKAIKPILPELIMNKNSTLIKPRTDKSKTEQLKRSKDNAEVFTPSWICNKQNNLIDEEWFSKKDVFNIEDNKSWKSTKNKIKFKKEKNWEDYIKETRLEMCCGEAPYLVSRYDNVTGDEIKLEERIGMLDRKFRIINENVEENDAWLNYALIALKSIYGYEFQGDNLFIARCNILLTFIDYYINKFNKEPDLYLIKQVIEIITWNIFQMDGIKLVIPYSCHEEEVIQISLFSDIKEKGEFCLGCRNNNPKDHNGKRCYIMDWEKNKKIKYVDLLWK